MGTRKPKSSVTARGYSPRPVPADTEPPFRIYPMDSPQAAARILALALLADGSIQLSELSMLARRGILLRLGITEAGFDKVIHELCDDLLAGNRATDAGDLLLGRDVLRRILSDIDHPELQRKLLRGVLDIVHADGELAGGEAVLLSVAADCWQIDPFDSYRILAKPGRRRPPQAHRARRDSPPR